MSFLAGVLVGFLCGCCWRYQERKRVIDEVYKMVVRMNFH